MPIQIVVAVETLSLRPHRRPSSGALVTNELAERPNREIIAAFIDKLAERAEGFAAQAGVGGMEIAGGLISYLAEHPDDLEPFLNGGFFELPPDWCMRGCLTYHAINGKVMHPQTARYSRIINGITALNGETDHG